MKDSSLFFAGSFLSLSLVVVGCGGGGEDTAGTGGSSSGGASTGGTPSGGASSGASGGTASGGSATGGDNDSGGTSSGGASGATLIGTPCEEDSDCPYEGGWCRTDYTNGYCTKDCDSLGACEDSGVICNLGLGQCLKLCTVETESSDCRVDEGYRCVTRLGGSGCEV